MSIIETLTEGIVNRNMQEEGAALLNKWSSTGLLEGLSNDNDKANMARLLENQAKELLRESNTMQGGSVEGFAAVAFPIVRRVFAGLIANDLVSVQPMSLPSGLIFFLDFTFGTELGDQTMNDRLGNTAGASIYGTDRVGSEVTGGVNLVGQTLKEDLSGPRASARGYAYASATGSFEVAAANQTNHRVINVSASISDSDRKALSYDPDIMVICDAQTAAHTTNILEVEILEAGLAAQPQLDLDNLSAFDFTGTNGVDAITGVNGAVALRRLSRLANTAAGETAGSAFFYFIGESGSAVTNATPKTAVDLTGSTPFRDNLVDGGALGSIEGASSWPLEGASEIPEIDIKVDSIAITAQTKKLKAKWTPELGQDLNAYHNLDAEVELTSILSEQIALELDREILADLVNGATAATLYWSRSPGLFVNRTTGAEIGSGTNAPDFTGTVSEWYETLIETINDVSAQIHRKTLRGGANYIVCSPEVANVLEFTAGFRANVTADADKGDIGAVKVGSLNRKFDVIVDPYFARNAILVGRKGASFLESGYVYAPYVPLQTTPTIFGPEDFVPRKGVMTRYAKKMVRPDMYGLVIVRDL